MPGHRKSLKSELPNKKQILVKQTENSEPTTNLPGPNIAVQPPELPDDRSEVCLVSDTSHWSEQMGVGDVKEDTGCGACAQLLKGSITQFMTSEKFLEKYPERIEGQWKFDCFMINLLQLHEYMIKSLCYQCDIVKHANYRRWF